MSVAPLHGCSVPVGLTNLALSLLARDPYRGTSLMRNSIPLEPYSRTMPRDLWHC